MLYGFISGGPGCYHIKIEGYPVMNYMWYTKRESIRRYREQFNLKYKRVLWC